MKVILYMAITANGFIAKTNDDTSFVSKEECDSYSAAVRKAGNVIIGHRTYDIITKQPEFQEFKDVKVVIISNKPFETIAKNHIVVDSPKKALALLNGFENVTVAGGAILNASFLKDNLIDEIYLDVEPVLLSKGIPLINGSDFEKHLRLLGTKQITENEIQLHYQVIK